MAEEKVGDIVYIETNDYLCPMRVNGYKDRTRQKVLSLVYLEGPNKGRSEFVKVEEIIRDTEAWYEEGERKELNEKLRNFFKTADLDLMTCRVLAQIVKV